MVNENGIVRIKEREFGNFYHALNQAAGISSFPVQTIYELWLGQVIANLSADEILNELLELIDDLGSE